MKNLKGILFLAAVVMLLMSVNTMAASSSVLMQEVNETTIKRAVFGAFLSALILPNADNPDFPTTVDTAISVTNCTTGKDDLEGVIGDRQDDGAFHIILVNADGSVITHESGGVDGNQGDSWDGVLEAGETWTARLAEVLVAEGETADGFQGYAWVCSEFDCLSGTYTVTIFNTGFTQSFEFLPGMGQGGMFGGIALPLP